MLRQIVGAAIMAIGFASNASAQSAEETVAYLLFGLEDEAYSTMPGFIESKQIKVWKDLEEENIWYSMVVNQDSYGAFVINETDDCVFEIVKHFLRTRDDSPLQGPATMNVDLSNLTSANFGSMMGTRSIEYNRVDCSPVSGANGCELFVGQRTTVINEPRWNRALGYFQQEYCQSGKAF